MTTESNAGMNTPTLEIKVEDQPPEQNLNAEREENLANVVLSPLRTGPAQLTVSKQKSALMLGTSNNKLRLGCGFRVL